MDSKETKEWVPNKAGVREELLKTVKAKKLAYYGHTMRKQGSCLEKEIGLMQGTMPGARRQGRPRTAWMDNFKTWTELTMEKSIRMAEDRDKWRKYVHGVANPRIELGRLKNRTEQSSLTHSRKVSCGETICLPPMAVPRAYRRCSHLANTCAPAMATDSLQFWPLPLADQWCRVSIPTSVL